MQRSDLTGQRQRKLMGQQITEQVMVAIPLTALIERNRKQVGALQLDELARGVGSVQQRIAQRAGQARHDRGAQQEILDGRALTAQDLCHQVIDDLAIIAGEGGNVAPPVLAVSQRQADQLQSRGPSLRALPQNADLLGRQAQPQRPVEQRRRLPGAQPQVRRPNLQQLSARPQPRQRQRRITAPGQRHLHRPGKVVDEERHRLMHIGAADHVVVIEHQHDRARQQGERIDQQRQRQLGHIPASQPQRIIHPRTRIRRDGAHCRQHIIPEANRIVVTAIQRQPRKRAVLRGIGPPTRQHGRLAGARRRRDKNQPRPGAITQLRDQARARNPVGRQHRNVQLRSDKRPPARLRCLIAVGRGDGLLPARTAHAAQQR